MITLENEGTTFHPLGLSLFPRWFGTKCKVEKYSVSSLSAVDKSAVLLPLPKSLDSGF